MFGGNQGQCAQATFTVEQIELIRRLRNSGLNKEQVIQAFESFERVDSDLGNLYNLPMTMSFSQQKSFTVLGVQCGKSQNNGPLHIPNPSCQPATEVTSANTNEQDHHTAPAVGHVNRRFHSVRRIKELKMDQEEGPIKEDVIKLTMHEVCPEAQATVLFTGDGNSKEVDDFMNQGKEEMHAEIRDFLLNHPSTTQSDIALAAGVNVTCVSKFLTGNFSSIQAPILRQLCQWFVGTRTQNSAGKQNRQQCNTHTSKMLHDVIQDRLMSGATTTVTGNGACPMDVGVDIKTGDGVLGACWAADQEGLAVNFTPRRERFTFRKKHLEVLENYFKTNQYPTYEERSDIAMKCNDIMQVVSGRGLCDKERMTPQNVAYWFSNRRKDIKRMAREGGIEMSEVVLPSKVKQSPPQLSLGDSDTASISSTWAMDSPVMSYSPVDVPSVGPVAFPTMLQCSYSDTVNSIDTKNVSSASQAQTGVIKIEAPEADSVSGSPETDRAASPVESLSTATLTNGSSLSTITPANGSPLSTVTLTNGSPLPAATLINGSCSTVASLSGVVVTSGPGSAVERISSHLMAKTSTSNMAVSVISLKSATKSQSSPYWENKAVKLETN